MSSNSSSFRSILDTSVFNLVGLATGIGAGVVTVVVV
jgi:hypothetical protein